MQTHARSEKLEHPPAEAAWLEHERMHGVIPLGVAVAASDVVVAD